LGARAALPALPVRRGTGGDTLPPRPHARSGGDRAADHGTIVDRAARARATHAYAAPCRYAVRVTVTAHATDTAFDTLTAFVEPPATPQVFVGAGDIASCWRAHAVATAQLIDSIPGTVFALGDNAYPNGTAVNYAECYQPTWGRFKKRTHPVPGNHDYDTPAAPGYFGYFGAAAGEQGCGYY